MQLYAEKDRNGVLVIKKRTGTAFRCVPARNEPWSQHVLFVCGHTCSSTYVILVAFPPICFTVSLTASLQQPHTCPTAFLLYQLSPIRVRPFVYHSPFTSPCLLGLPFPQSYPPSSFFIHRTGFTVSFCCRFSEHIRFCFQFSRFFLFFFYCFVR